MLVGTMEATPIKQVRLTLSEAQIFSLLHNGLSRVSPLLMTHPLHLAAPLLAHLTHLHMAASQYHCHNWEQLLSRAIALRVGPHLKVAHRLLVHSLHQQVRLCTLCGKQIPTQLLTMVTREARQIPQQFSIHLALVE